MSRKTLLAQTRRHVWIFDEDWEWAEQYCVTRPGMTPGKVVRLLFHKWVLQAKERQASEAATAPSGRNQGAPE